MTKYLHDDNELNLWRGMGSVYKAGKLLFRGDGYVALKFFISNTNNDPNVLKKFEQQLNMREACRFSKQDDLKLREENNERTRKELTAVKEPELNKKFKKRGRGV